LLVEERRGEERTLTSEILPYMALFVADSSPAGEVILRSTSFYFVRSTHRDFLLVLYY
jgi:hypothetical protein